LTKPTLPRLVVASVYQRRQQWATAAGRRQSPSQAIGADQRRAAVGSGGVGVVKDGARTSVRPSERASERLASCHVYRRRSVGAGRATFIDCDA